MADIKCPYCGQPQKISHDDGTGYEEDTLHHKICDSCEKTFCFTTTITFDYEAYEADCLNDGEHKWELTHAAPRCFSQMECETCGKRRELTEQERKLYDIETLKEYRDKLANS